MADVRIGVHRKTMETNVLLRKTELGSVRHGAPARATCPAALPLHPGDSSPRHWIAPYTLPAGRLPPRDCPPRPKIC